jgi:AsmA protein
VKKILIGLLVVVVLVVGALFALPLFIPSDTVKAELISRLEAATGRDVRIDGPVSISVLPTASLSAKGVGLAGLTGDSEAFSVDSVSFGLSLIPLLSGNVDINAVTIEKPRIVVAFDKNGQSNWSGAPAPQAKPAAEAKPKSIEGLIEGDQPATPPAAAAPAADAFAALENLTISRVSIVDGTVIYRDAAGTDETIEALNLDIRMPRMIGAGAAEGSFVWQGHKETVALTIGERPTAQLLEQIPVALTLSADGGSLTAKGTALSGDTLFAGTIEAKGSSLYGFAKGFGAELPDAPAFAAFSFAGPLAVDRAGMLIKTFKGEVGGIPIGGGVRLVYDRERPGIGLKLDTGRIDTALFTPKSGGGGGGGKGEAGGSGKDDAIDLSALGVLDANVDFSASEVAMGDATLAKLGMNIKLAKGVLTTTINSVEINGAPGSGTLTVDSNAANPTIGGSVKMNGIDLAGLAALTGASLPATGAAGLDVTFKTSGATTQKLLANLEASGAASLKNGTVTGLNLADMVGGDAKANSVEQVDLTARFDSLSSPVSVDGALTWRGERFTVSGSADARAMIDGKDTQMQIKATSKGLNVAFAGIASSKGFGTGKVALSTPSLRKLLAWIGQPMGAGGGLEAFSIDGTVSLDADKFTFDKTAFTLDKSSGLGTGEVVFAGKPKVKAGLAMKVLDVTPYLAASGATGGKSGGSGGGGDGGGGDTPIDFSGLSAIDADLNLKADSILADNIKIGPSALTVKLAGGKLDANLSEMSLYSGSGTGTVAIDGAAATPSTAASFRLKDVSALPFLTDAIGFKRVEGSGSFAFDLKTAGKTQAALMKSLSGQGSMTVSKGAILGIDIPHMLQSLSVNTLLGWQPGKDRTEFDQINASFTITNGILVNKDLVIAGPLFALNGAGQIDIPNQTVSYRINPQVATSGKQGELQNFTVPVRIEGPLDKPKIYPEIQGILDNPQAALDQLRSMGGGLFGGDNSKKAAKSENNGPADQTGSVEPDKKKSKDKGNNNDGGSAVNQILNLLNKQ